MKRPAEPMSRRDLVKLFGLSAFVFHPIMRSAAYAAPSRFAGAPRYIHFFKGGAFYPSRTNPSSIDNLAGTPIAPLQPHARDLILFRNMNIHGGSPKTNGYQEEHAGGLFGCATGDRYKYFKNDAYFAYTDNESIDITIANHYGKTLKDVPLASLHIGAGAHSDSDSSGAGNRYISFKKRTPGDSRHWGNAVEPVQSAGEVYDQIMRAAANYCARLSNQPAGDVQKLAAAPVQGKSVLDVMREQRSHSFQSGFAKGSAVALAIEERQDAIREIERKAVAAPAPAPQPAAVQKASAKSCPTLARPGGNGANKANLDDLSPVHDQMISLIKLAFEMDVTRVVAFTLSGASSGQRWPSRGINQAHHTLEHNGNVDGLVKLDTYYSEKFAGLLAALKSIPEGDKTALYNSSVFLGMECWSNSSSGHYLKNIPFVFAGQGAGRFETGRIIDAKGRNNNDIHISCLKAAGIDTNVFGMQSLCQGAII